MSIDSERSHVEVMLAVSCCDPAEVSTVVEKLARVMAGLALDGHDARLNVWRYSDVDEDQGKVIEP